MQNQNIKSYAGFTIGPIYDVMRHSKKTRELWFGSYFFSWYMEMLISKLIIDDVTFLVPDVSNIANITKTLAGKYNDRFVLSSPSLSLNELYDKILQANDCTLNFFVELLHVFANKETKTVLCDGDKIEITRTKTPARMKMTPYFTGCLSSGSKELPPNIHHSPHFSKTPKLPGRS